MSSASKRVEEIFRPRGFMDTDLIVSIIGGGGTELQQIMVKSELRAYESENGLLRDSVFAEIADLIRLEKQQEWEELKAEIGRIASVPLNCIKGYVGRNVAKMKARLDYKTSENTGEAASHVAAEIQIPKENGENRPRGLVVSH